MFYSEGDDRVIDCQQSAETSILNEILALKAHLQEITSKLETKMQ